MPKHIYFFWLNVSFCMGKLNSHLHFPIYFICVVCCWFHNLILWDQKKKKIKSHSLLSYILINEIILLEYCRNLLGEELGTLSSKELEQLEQQLETTLREIRSTKVMRFYVKCLLNDIIFTIHKLFKRLPIETSQFSIV